MRPSSVASLCLLLALTASAATAADRDVDSVPLRWTPSESSSGSDGASAVDPAPFVGVRILFDRFTDRREGDPQGLGERTDKRGTHPVTTPDDVVDFVTRQVTEAFTEQGVPLVDDRLLKAWGAKLEPRPQPIVRLKGEVIGFHAEAAEVLLATVEIGCVVEDAEGKPIWSGSSKSQAGREARSYTVADWQEALSDALAEAIAQLAGSADFVRALSGRREESTP